MVEQLSLLNVSAAQIAKKSGMKRPQVDQALAVTRSDLARAASERYELTLDQAAAGAEFENAADTVKALVATARTGQSVIADLEMLNDPDHRLAILGRQPAAPMYFPPSDAQPDVIAALLPDAPISREQKLGIALAAGLKELMAELRSPPHRPAASEEATMPNPDLPGSWWQRLLGRARHH